MTIPKMVLEAARKRLIMLIVAPFVVICTLLLILAQGIHQYPLVVCNQDAGFEMPLAGHLNMPEKVVQALDSDDFAITTVKNPAEAQKLYDSGQVKAMLVFPANLSEDMMIKLDDPTYVLPEKAKIELAEANPLARLLVLASLVKSSSTALKDAGDNLSTDSLPVPLDIAAIMAGFEPASHYFVLALLGFICYVLTGIFALGAATSLRAQRTALARNSLAAMLSFVAAFSIAGYALYLALVSAVLPILGLSMSTAIYSSSPIVWLLLSVGPALVFLVGLNASEVKKTRPIIAYFILPLFFGGFLFPAELMPVWLQWFKYLFPPFYGLNAALSAELGTINPFQLGEILITAGWLLLFMILGTVALRKSAMAGPAKS